MIQTNPYYQPETTEQATEAAGTAVAAEAGQSEVAIAPAAVERAGPDLAMGIGVVVVIAIAALLVFNLRASAGTGAGRKA